MRVLLPIGPIRRAGVPSQRASSAQRSTPSYCLSICMAWARRPGQRAISRVRIFFELRLMQPRVPRPYQSAIFGDAAESLEMLLYAGPHILIDRALLGGKIGWRNQR